MSRLNFAEQLVNSVTNRKKPIGFRTAAPGDQTGDPLAWETWIANHMQVQIRDLFDDEGTYGSAFLTVTGQQLTQLGGDHSMPLMVRSNGWNTAVERNPIRPWVLDAVVTVGHSDVYGVDTLTLLRPGYFRQAFRRAAVSTIPSDGSVWYPGTDWTWVDGPQALGYTDEVPCVEFSSPGGIGEFELHIDTLDRINHTILQQLIITAMQAFRQRGIMPGKTDGENGEPEAFPEFYPAEHPNAGERIDYDKIYEAGPAALWFLPKDSKVWESSVTDIRPIIEAVSAHLKHLAGASSTPLYVLSPEAANGSAEGAALARETNLFKVGDRIERDTSSLARAQYFAFLARRDMLRADAATIETIWSPVEFADIGKRAAAARDAKQGGLSQSMINEKFFQLTPAELAQETTNHNDELFDAVLAGSSSTVETSTALSAASAG
jgi:hypothetical protein